MAENIVKSTQELAPGSLGILPKAGQLIQQLQEIVESPAFQRSLPVLVAVAVCIIGLVAFFWMQKPERTTLYASLPEQEKSRVIDALKNSGVDVAVDPTTGDILVPTTDYHSSKITLAAQGLPTVVPTGYEKIDSIQMGSSRSVEAMLLKQAQELELARSINEIS